ncbi:DUF1365 domain-containing protein [Maricaulis salignorans]|uniref:DUF1365 domain-containing protein n=1 Tax=Maricaulis salignorans TaxID=144026 RepID=UPI003A938ECB
MTPLPASLLDGDIGHTRLGPKRHSLRYRMHSVLLDIDGPELARIRSPLFSVNRFNLVSFQARDHGRGDDRLRPWVHEQLDGEAADFELGRVQILAAPRVLGLVFNPVTVLFCHDRSEALRAVIFQVSNFHGGRCAYTFMLPPAFPGKSLRFSSSKRFFVSPFNDTNGEYRFRLDRDQTGLRLAIQLYREGACVLSAVQKCTIEPLTTRHLVRAPFSLAFNTIKIVGAILLEAARLRLKGLRLYTPRHGSIDTRPWRQ